jgi:hypothetical protein
MGGEVQLVAEQMESELIDIRGGCLAAHLSKREDRTVKLRREFWFDIKSFVGM